MASQQENRLDIDPSAPRLFRALFVASLRAPGRLASPLVATLQWVMRATHCANGKHARSGNYCIYGCGTLLNKDAYQDWLVDLANGEQRVVRAVNAHHAKSLVVHGPRGPRGAVLVHPSNVVRIRPAQQAAAPASDDQH